MPLEPGTQLGAYEILAPLGAGGMGEVYKARDTQLGREVAIKTLPSARAGNEDRKRRFLQEARAASALNHPGIVTIHDISRSGEIDYIVMEYVRGRTLDRVIGKHGLGVQESIRYALQIADALGKAHAAGIIHRDLKPANIMVTDDGIVKILDFGLAKLGEVEEVGETDVTRSMHQIEGAHTQDGAVLGTVAYMSPEQAEGKKVDARCDIFSFGAVLYEMVTGRRAFTGDSSASTMAAVLKSDPKPPSQIVEGLPRDFERIILRCLRKDPSKRFQHVTDLKVDLEELKETTDSGDAAQPVAARKKSRKLPWIAAAVGVPVLAVVGWLLLRPAGESPTAPVEPVPLTSYEGVETEPSFSPDGSQVVFSWNGENQDNYDLYVKVVGPGSPVRLTSDPARDGLPAWSPDGRQIAFVREGQGIFLIAPIGGTERKLVNAPRIAGRPAWFADGKLLVFGRVTTNAEPGGIFVIAAQGGDIRRITSTESFADACPAISPDGRWLAFASCARGAACSLAIVEVDTGLRTAGPPRRLVAPSRLVESIAWTPDGQSLIFGLGGLGPTDGRLYRIAAHGAAEPAPLTFAGPGSTAAAVSWPGSRLAYSYTSYDWDLSRIENGAVVRSPLSSTRSDYSPQFSPDGRKVAFTSVRSGSQEVWVANPDGSNAVQVTSSRASGSARWSPDGSRLVYDTWSPEGQWDISLVDVSGGQPQVLVRDPASDNVPSFSRDGNWVYFASARSGRQEIYRIPTTGGEPVRMTEGGGYVPLESVDGRSIYYTKVSGTCGPLFVRSVSGGPERQVADSVCQRAVAVTERGVYYISGNPKERAYVVRLLDATTGESKVVGRIDGRPFLGIGLGVSPDGKTVLFAGSAKSGSDLMLVEGFQ